jgi:MFS family permease
MLGFVSMFMDMSSELIHAVLPIYFTTVLGLSAFTVGVVEGVAEATASMLKVVSGTISDRFARRKPLALLGYGLSALTKPLFPLADSVIGVVAARFLDRVGKGIRSSPRDALVADLTPPGLRDAAYGLRQSLDMIGALTGPLLAMGLLFFYSDALRTVLWFAAAPALVAVLLLWWGVEDTPPGTSTAPRGVPLGWAMVRGLPGSYWVLIALTSVFTFARLSEAFLVLAGQAHGLALVWIPAVMIVMSAAYSLSAYPAGLLGARFGRGGLLGAGMVVLALSQWTLTLDNSALFWLGIALWGVHMGLTQGVLAAAVADAAPAALRGTAFGVMHLATGVCQIAAGAMMGWIWARSGGAAAFTLGAAIALGGAGCVALARPR